MRTSSNANPCDAIGVCGGIAPSLPYFTGDNGKARDRPMAGPVREVYAVALLISKTGGNNGFQHRRKDKMVALKGVGATVVSRLEQIGFTSLPQLADQGRRC